MSLYIGTYWYLLLPLIIVACATFTALATEPVPGRRGLQILAEAAYRLIVRAVLLQPSKPHRKARERELPKLGEND